ncbi:MAG: DUF1904 family protein [Lachnospirales bacterium]
MPHINFINASLLQDKDKIKKLNEDLSSVVGSPTDWFTFTFLSSDTKTFQLDCDITDKIIFVEVKWFERPKEVKERVLDLIYNYLKSYVIEDKEIVITFTNLDKDNYFEF